MENDWSSRGSNSNKRSSNNSEHWLNLALQAGRMVAWEQDLKSNYVTRSLNSEDLVGIGSGPLRDILKRIHPDDRNIRAELGQTAELDEVTFRCLGPDGEVIWLATRAQRISPDRLIGISFDITELKSARDRIDVIANTDELTGLPNRLFFRKSLKDAISKASAEETTVSLFMLNFDYFKDINDTFGHDAGDAFLKGVTERLKSLTAPDVLIARLSGDEFGIIAENLDESSSAMLARKISRRAGKQVRYKDHALWAKVSVGMARCPEHASSSEALIKAADIALFKAKTNGRNQVRSYTEKMGAAVIERARIVEEISLGLLRGEVVPPLVHECGLRTWPLRLCQPSNRSCVAGHGCRSRRQLLFPAVPCVRSAMRGVSG